MVSEPSLSQYGVVRGRTRRKLVGTETRAGSDAGARSMVQGGVTPVQEAWCRGHRQGAAPGSFGWKGGRVWEFKRGSYGFCREGKFLLPNLRGEKWELLLTLQGGFGGAFGRVEEWLAVLGKNESITRDPLDPVTMIVEPAVYIIFTDLSEGPDSRCNLDNLGSAGMCDPVVEDIGHHFNLVISRFPPLTGVPLHLHITHLPLRPVIVVLVSSIRSVSRSSQRNSAEPFVQFGFKLDVREFGRSSKLFGSRWRAFVCGRSFKVGEVKRGRSSHSLCASILKSKCSTLTDSFCTSERSSAKARRAFVQVVDYERPCFSIWTDRTNLGWQLMRVPVTTSPGCTNIEATQNSF
ncbi:hypothetical protein LR48_Vigan10g244000 [Vigna angularis]|uniref:Uncharacterized protein n=1 Tax=Phaseolus angularis TaxID=3914 RepID=A0A0L9VNM2_PHAAN|nr:hypothetical protein LR48_Vigan10g244000 [Vigna angularis]